jgi:O-antigen/teichoic acid export membrane protein
MRGVARGASANLLGAVAMAGAQLAVTFFVAERMSKALAGVFFASTSVFLLATTLGMLGTNTGLVYFVARCRALERVAAIPAYFRAGLWPVVVVGCGMSAALLLFAPSLAALINPAYPDQTTTYLRILAVFIPFAGVENVTLAASRGLGAMRATVVIEQFGRSALQVLLVGVALVVATPAALGAGWAFPYLPAAVVAVLWWRRQSRRVLGREEEASTLSAGQPGLGGAEPPAPVAREFWSFTGPRALASVASLAIQRVDVILVAAIAGAPSAAVYFVATRFLVVGQMGNRAISLAVQPRLAETLSHDNRSATNEYYQSSTAWLIVLTWPLYILLIGFAGTFLGLLDKDYSSGSTALVILCAAMLFATLCGMVDMVLNMGGRTSWNLGNVLVALGVNLGLDLWLIPIYGIEGAAIGWAAAIVVQNALALSQTGLILGLHPFGRAGLIAVVLNVVCFGVVGALARLTLGPTWWAVLATAVVGGALYLLAMWLLRRTLRLDALAGLRRSTTANPPAHG